MSPTFWISLHLTDESQIGSHVVLDGSWKEGERCLSGVNNEVTLNLFLHLFCFLSYFVFLRYHVPSWGTTCSNFLSTTSAVHVISSSSKVSQVRKGGPGSHSQGLQSFMILNFQLLFWKDILSSQPTVWFTLLGHEYQDKMSIFSSLYFFLLKIYFGWIYYLTFFYVCIKIKWTRSYVFLKDVIR